MLYVDIKKRVDNFHLDIGFEVNREVLGILGSSGSGKSMTLKCIAGIETPDEGKIILDGKVLFDSEKKINLPPQRRRVGYLFQSYALFPNMTVEENIAIGVRGTRDYKGKVVREMIASLHLSGLEMKRPPQLSGGQQQRVALARVLASDPEIIMLDEPFSALDSHLKWKLEQEIMDVISNYRGTTLLVSHNRDEIYRLSNKVAVVSGGSIDAFGEKANLFEEPQTLDGAILTGCKNISRAVRLSEHELQAQAWGLKLKTKQEIPMGLQYVGIRAHYLQVGDDAKPENVAVCELIKEIENPFSYTVMLRVKNNTATEEGSLIRWEMEKPIWEQVRNKELAVSFPGDCLLLLEHKEEKPA